MIEYPKELAEKLTERAAGFSKIYGSEIAEVEKILGRELTGKMRGKASKHKVGYEGSAVFRCKHHRDFCFGMGTVPRTKGGLGRIGLARHYAADAASSRCIYRAEPRYGSCRL